ncbi:MAG: 4-phosphoerythronate dehydrogenase, partial [Xanthomonadales bacterium]|nr:4-phosphoerythronate dehydrogenase [Xanthomonadales bacterium]
IGTDHLDTQWLDDQGITWSAAPGCNADAAAQYTLAMILLACERLEHDIQKRGVGIIGYGNVGSRLRRLLNSLGVANVACDPPLQDQGTKGLVSMDEALDHDIVSLHVPLTRNGPYPTRHLINRQNLKQVREGALLVNTSRGDVIESNALLHSLQNGRLNAALDVWPNEPAISTQLLDATVVASPHVAGYSFEGKQNGTLQIYHAFCNWLGIEHESWPNQQKLVPVNPADLAKSLTRSCAVETDDRNIRRLGGLPPDEVASGFDNLRKDYRLRHDISA